MFSALSLDTLRRMTRVILTASSPSSSIFFFFFFSFEGRRLLSNAALLAGTIRRMREINRASGHRSQMDAHEARDQIGYGLTQFGVCVCVWRVCVCVELCMCMCKCVRVYVYVRLLSACVSVCVSMCKFVHVHVLCIRVVHSYCTLPFAAGPFASSALRQQHSLMSAMRPRTDAQRRQQHTESP